MIPGLGDFCQQTYRLTCLFARLRCRDSGHIVRLGTGCRSLKANQHPAPFGIFVSGNRLTRPVVAEGTTACRRLRLLHLHHLRIDEHGHAPELATQHGCDRYPVGRRALQRGRGGSLRHRHQVNHDRRLDSANKQMIRQ